MAKKEIWMNFGKLKVMVTLDTMDYGLMYPQNNPLTDCNRKHVEWYLNQEGWLDEINQNRKEREEN